MKDFSIECAKSYTDDDQGQDLIEALKEKIKSITYENKTFSVVLLVDDQSHKNKAFNFDDYASWLKNKYNNSFIMKESQLLNTCDEVFAKLTNESLRNKIFKNKKYSGSFFIAVWCLLRLGYITNKEFPKKLHAKMLFNILPLHFKSGEDESIGIIKNTPYAGAVERIKYHFIKK